MRVFVTGLAFSTPRPGVKLQAFYQLECGHWAEVDPVVAQRGIAMHYECRTCDETPAKKGARKKR